MSTITAVPPLFAWKDEYNLGIEKIDGQHKQLVLMVSQLHRAMMQGKANEVLAEIFDKLVRYTETHFAEEEALMRQHGYPRLTSHAAEHRRLTTLAHKLRADCAEGRLSITIDTLNFLKTWLNDHILGMDREFGQYVNQKGK